MKLGYQTNTWGGVVGHPGGVTSIKDSFYLANGSTEEALKDIADAGYQGFEIFDGNLMQYASNQTAFRELMESNRLELIGVYSGANFIYESILEEELIKIENVSKLAVEFGARHLVVGGGAVRSNGILDSDFRLLGEGLNKVIEIADKYNLIASYHPHLGSMVETPEQVEKLLPYTEINFCPDTAHIEAGGGDPVEFMRKYKQRIKYVHFKDFHSGEFVPLGKGSQQFSEMVELLKEMDYQDWITVELDSYSNPKEGAMISRDYLKSHLHLG